MDCQMVGRRQEQGFFNRLAAQPGIERPAIECGTRSGSGGPRSRGCPARQPGLLESGALLETWRIRARVETHACAATEPFRSIPGATGICRPRRDERPYRSKAGLKQRRRQGTTQGGWKREFSRFGVGLSSAGNERDGILAAFATVVWGRAGVRLFALRFALRQTEASHRHSAHLFLQHQVGSGAGPFCRGARRIEAATVDGRERLRARPGGSCAERNPKPEGPMKKETRMLEIRSSESGAFAFSWAFGIRVSLGVPHLGSVPIESLRGWQKRTLRAFSPLKHRAAPTGN